MAGPAKKRAQAEKKSNVSSEEHKSSHNSGREETPQRSTPKSLPHFDGNRDPQTMDLATLSQNSADYANLRNISDALGMAGWYIARGVSYYGRALVKALNQISPRLLCICLSLTRCPYPALLHTVLSPPVFNLPWPSPLRFRDPRILPH